MHYNNERILTTHTGSLIRPHGLRKFINTIQKNKPYNEFEFLQCLSNSVEKIVAEQFTCGIDIVSDGEFGKLISWSQYPIQRLSGFECQPISTKNPFEAGADRERFKEFYAELDKEQPVATVTDTICVGPIKYTGTKELQRDIINFKTALKAVQICEGFLPVAAPASVIPDRQNKYYRNDRDCLEAIAQAMAIEYRAIIDAGLILQLDDARAAVTFDRMVPPASLDDYRMWLSDHIEVTNQALDGIPAEKVRYHVCWGSWPGPHCTDVPLKEIIDLILQINAGAYVIEGANPRHEHEWKIWEEVDLPEDKVLIHGVVSHSTNVVEHPELIAERIVRMANLIGRERVIAGTDCGFAQGPLYQRVHPSIMWAKLEAMTEGAKIATQKLWP
ncbi:MAG: cobalamin-independent methionine synthase II family protein [Pseudomonadota bacterium]|nr:cobalamin-independent methionine synthase II family protein [Pseudomonadota bacterium]